MEAEKPPENLTEAEQAKQKKPTAPKEREGPRVPADILEALEGGADSAQRREVIKQLLKLPKDQREQVASGLSSALELANKIGSLAEKVQGEEKHKEKIRDLVLEFVSMAQVDIDLFQRVFQGISIKKPEEVASLAGARNEGINTVAINQPSSEKGKSELCFSEGYFKNLNRIDQLRLLGHELMHTLFRSTFTLPERLKASLPKKSELNLALETYYIRKLQENQQITDEEFLEEFLCERFADFSLISKETLPKKLTFEEWVKEQNLSGGEEEMTGAYQEYEEKRLEIAASHMLAIRLISIIGEEGANQLKALLGDEAYKELTNFLDPKKEINLAGIDFKKFASSLSPEAISLFQKELERNKNLYKAFEEHLEKIRTESGHKEAIEKHKKEETAPQKTAEETPGKAIFPSELEDMMEPIPYFGMDSAGTKPTGFGDFGGSSRSIEVISTGVASLIAEIIPGARKGV